MTIAVVGHNSFIARALHQQPRAATWRFLSAAEAEASDAWLEGVEVVLNCAFDPQLKLGPYTAERDIDLRLAQRLVERPGVRYLMLSSRLVYGPAEHDGRLTERDLPQPISRYGAAKWQTEQALHALLGERLTILRLSNICGLEVAPGRQNFFAIAQRSLLNEGRIVLDMSPFVERDFLPVDVLASWLPQVVAQLLPGVFNIGAGRGTPTGRIAQWLIEGFGRGELLVSQLREYDPFWLDISAAVAAFDIPGVGQAQLRDYCRGLGTRLREVEEPA